jgi:signal transduction histidine kinase
MFNYWIRSLAGRLWLASITALAVGMATIAAIIIYAINIYPPQAFQRNANLKLAHHAAALLSFDPAGRPVSVDFDSETAWLFDPTASELMYRVLDADGQLVFASRGGYGGKPWAVGDLAAAAGTSKSVMIDNRSFDVVTLKVRRGPSTFFFQTATSIPFDKAIRNQKVLPIPKVVGDTTLIATLIFGLTLTFSVRRVLRPLRTVSLAAAQITPRNLTARLSTVGVPSEIKPLINAFNDALTRLENGYNVQQQFLAAAAHELQTPLTLIRGQIELQPGVEHKDLLFREIDLMARQVRQLLHLAEVSESQNFSFEEVDRLDVAEDVVSYLSAKADKMQVKLGIELVRVPTPIKADRSALFILLKNIIENAINVTPPHGSVTVLVDDFSIQIRDQGPGIKAEHLPFLFERFWRAPDAPHDGSGLGLSICREIAIAHEWRIAVKTLVCGTQFIIWFKP